MAVVRSNSIDANSEGHTMGGGAYVDGGNGCGYDMDLTGFNIDFPIAGVSTPESLPLYSKPRPTYTLPEHPMGSKRELKVIFVGMGASGINFAYQLQQQTELVELQIYEKNDQLGGTWYENRYPGCACDIPSVGYQFSWATQSTWSHYYAGAKEILAYFRKVANEHKLLKYAKFNHEVVGAEWEETEGLWKVSIRRHGNPADVFVDYAHFFIHGGGLLNDWKWPSIPGLTSFKGTLLHSADWNEAADLQRKRVCVIGTGSSGVQIIPSIVDDVDHLYVASRSPLWITSGFASRFASSDGTNFAYPPEMQKQFEQDPDYYLHYRKAIEIELNKGFKSNLTGTPEALKAKEFSKTHMAKALAKKPELIEKMIPQTFDFGCRRPTPGNGFLEALVMDKTTVLSEQIAAIVPNGIRLQSGETIEVGVIVCATGFDTSYRPRYPIYARGRNLQNEFELEPSTYLSLAAPEVPNYFIVQGAYSPITQGSVLPAIEVYTNYFLQVIKKVQAENIKSMQPSRRACEEFIAHADEFIKHTAWVGKCASWFKAGQSNKPMVWPGSRVHSLSTLERPRFEDYEIEYLGPNRFSYLGNGFHVREYDGRDTTWYYGLLGGKDIQPEDFDLGPFDRLHRS